MLSLPEDTPKDDPAMVELELLSNLVADYDEKHYPTEGFIFSGLLVSEKNANFVTI